MWLDGKRRRGKKIDEKEMKGRGNSDREIEGNEGEIKEQGKECRARKGR